MPILPNTLIPIHVAHVQKRHPRVETVTCATPTRRLSVRSWLAPVNSPFASSRNAGFLYRIWPSKPIIGYLQASFVGTRLPATSVNTGCGSCMDTAPVNRPTWATLLH